MKRRTGGGGDGVVAVVVRSVRPMKEPWRPRDDHVPSSDDGSSRIEDRQKKSIPVDLIAVDLRWSDC